MLQETNNQLKSQTGFTLIELLVVVAIIALLSSIALIAFMSARQKSRDVKRLGDMTQMNTGLELFFAANKGYPSSTNGLPDSMAPNFVSTLPSAPIPADGVCYGQIHSNDSCTNADTNCANVPLNSYYYVPSGTPTNGVYPDYAYYFCLGNQTGNFSSGSRILTPTGLK